MGELKPIEKKGKNPLEEVIKKRDMDYGYEDLEDEAGKDPFMQFLQFLRDRREMEKKNIQKVV